MRRHRRPPRGGARRAALRARPVAARSGPRGTLAVVEILLVDLEVPHVVAAPAPVGDDVAHLPPHLRGLERHPMAGAAARSEEHTSELQSLMRISYAVFCLKKKNNA